MSQLFRLPVVAPYLPLVAIIMTWHREYLLNTDPISDFFGREP